ncbi:MAG: zinc-ribbon domain-containing protein [Bacteroidaceae bacterium]|nr:zinc-ribbon domain-containing protein [Bacteroidaceae bacterium]
MPLIKCTECGHEVSERALACPNCGCLTKKGT